MVNVVRRHAAITMLLVVTVLALTGCAYRLGPYTPAPPLNCCHPSGAN
jgi:hypothetical protein